MKKRPRKKNFLWSKKRLCGIRTWARDGDTKKIDKEEKPAYTRLSSGKPHDPRRLNNDRQASLRWPAKEGTEGVLVGSGKE